MRKEYVLIRRSFLLKTPFSLESNDVSSKLSQDIERIPVHVLATLHENRILLRNLPH